VKRIANSAMKQSPPPFPAMDDLSGDEDAILRFLRIQLLQQVVARPSR